MRTWSRQERGQTIVEFALAVPVLLLVIIGIFDAGRMVWYSNTLAYAAREGTRYAIVHGASGSDPQGPPPLSDAGIRAAVERSATGVAGLNVVVTWPDGNSERGSRVHVHAGSVYVPTISGYLMNGAFTVPLRGASQMTIVR